jgi:hypothetical protein
MISEDIITESATIRLIAHGIIENIINDNGTLEIENVLEIKEVNKKLSNGQPYAVLVDSGMYGTISKEARELLASKEFAETTIAKALLVRSLGHRIVGKFYIRINKPFIPTKIFSDREEAINWLSLQLNNIK